MAGDWIKMRFELWDHPKVVRILSAMCPQNVQDSSEKCRIIGALFRTWQLFDQYTDDGILHGYDADALNSVVGIENWSENLQHVGWLSIHDQHLEMPEFTTHNGESAKRRSEDAKRKKASRKASAKRPQNVQKMSAKCPENCGPEKRREEKRREEGVPPPPPELPAVLDTVEFGDAWSDWEKHRREIKKKLTPTAVKQQVKRLEQMGHDRAIAAIRHSIANGWQGIFEPDERSGKASRSESGVDEWLRRQSGNSPSA